MEVVDVASGAVDIVEKTVKFLVDCNEHGEVQSKQVGPSIYMVPSAFRDLSPSSFNPRVVSIGPLHKQDENLQGFEAKKPTYLHNLLCRLALVPEKTLRECAEKVIRSIERIKACYAGLTSYNDCELAKMMVIDGCFILEFIASLFDENFSSRNVLIIGSIEYDLLMIENQIPFFVLEIIFECTFVASGRLVEGYSLTTHIGVIINEYKVFVGNPVVPNISLTSTHVEHILGFVHKYYQPVESMASVNMLNLNGHSAIELDRAGMNFKPNEVQNWALAMKLDLPKFSCFPWFWCKPTLRMPIVSLNDFSELILRNLMIYEQFSHVKKYVTSYISAMDMLIDTPQDVALLIKSKVLINYLGSTENAADMMNNLCKDVPLSDFFYYKEWEEMDAYYYSYWPNTVAGLKRTYFNNPWNIIALIAAFVLFALTVVQTIFTVNPKESHI